MINFEVRKSFIKDLKSLKGSSYYDRIKTFVFNELPTIKAFEEIRGIKKLKGFKNYYRIKIGNYRMGITRQNDTLIIERVLHRKDIYQHFPSK